MVRPLQRHSKSRPTHHRSGKDRKLLIATLGEKSTQPSPCEAPVKGSVPGDPRTTSFVKHEHHGALKSQSEPAPPACVTPSAMVVVMHTLFRIAIGIISIISILFGTGMGLRPLQPLEISERN